MMNNEIVKIKAVLIRPVNLNGVEVVFPAGTEIDLDPEAMIAHNRGVHFFVTKEEFKILYLN